MSVESVFSHHSDIYIFYVCLCSTFYFPLVFIVLHAEFYFGKIKTFKVSSCVFLTPATKNPLEKKEKKNNRDSRHQG